MTMQRLLTRVGNTELLVLLTGAVLGIQKSDYSEFGIKLTDDINKAHFVLRGDGPSRKLITTAEHRNLPVVSGISFRNALYHNRIISFIENVLNEKDNVAVYVADVSKETGETLKVELCGTW